jgi:hypothetical protein
MPYIATAIGLTQLPWWPPALPLAYASLALSVAAWARRGHGWAEWLAALLWAAGSVALATPLSAPPRDLEWLFAAIRIQAALTGAAVLGVFAVAVLTVRSRRDVMSRVIATMALLAIGGLLARSALHTIMPASTDSGGLDGIEREIRLFRMVVLISATALLASGVTSLLRRPSTV